MLSVNITLLLSTDTKQKTPIRAPLGRPLAPMACLLQANIYSNLLANDNYEDANSHNSFYLNPVFVPVCT